MLRFLKIAVLPLCLFIVSTLANDKSVDGTSGASPVLDIHDSTYSISFIDDYTTFVDSLVAQKRLVDYFHPNKTHVGALGGYYLKDTPLLLKGNDAGDIGASYYSVYLEKGAIRKIIHISRRYNPAGGMRKSAVIFDDAVDPFTEEKTIITLGNVLLFQFFRDGILVTSDEDIMKKVTMISAAEKMVALMKKEKVKQW